MHHASDLRWLIEQFKPDIAVETGVSTGESTRRILEAMDSIGKGILYSVDVAERIDFVHPRWVFVRGYSVECLPLIYRDTGPWSMFIHDSDHAVGCMTWEFEFAWNCIKPSGVIAADDTTWGTPPHDAWQKFANRAGISPQNLGHYEYCVKPEGSSVLESSRIDKFVSGVNDLANAACRAYGQPAYTPVRFKSKDYVLNYG